MKVLPQGPCTYIELFSYLSETQTCWDIVTSLDAAVETSLGL